MTNKYNSFFNQMYSLPYEDKIHTIVNDNNYGFAYWNPYSKDWISFVGTFGHVYGVFDGSYSMFPDEGDFNYYSVFFRLDNNCQPIEIINSVRYNEETGEMNENAKIIKRYLSAIMLENKDVDVVKPFKFEY